MTTITLYGAYPAFLTDLSKYPRARHFRPLWALYETGTDFEYKNVDFTAGERNPSNVLGEIPSLTDGDFTITESCAITNYLARQYGASSLYPFTTPQEDAKVEQFALFAQSTLETSVIAGIFANGPCSPFPAERRSSNVYENGLKSWNTKIVPAFNKWLENNKTWIMGDKFTVVDIFVAFPLLFAHEAGIITEEMKIIRSYFQRIVSRPSFQKAQQFFPRMKLYGFVPPGGLDKPHRPRQLRVQWTANELQVPLDYEEVDLVKGQQNEEWFKKINPASQIPVLVDGSFVLSESCAMCEYLVEKCSSWRNSGEKVKLIPSSKADKAQLQRITYFVTADFEQAVIMNMYRNSEFFSRPGEGKDEALYEEGKKTWLEKVVPTLQSWLGDKPYLLGTDFTLADIHVGYVLAFAETLGLLKEQPALAEYYKRITQNRPAWRKAMGRDC
eukprot:TRINITY_DN34345_c0_g1_i1.p1 TRINITY_DN34345_c0_g1~~TRINITY_DN34345_c0_g1_i1.p1  ORF type:complete len:457 (+),score=17.73 TRINITY_DN34345_c0_g1_i1:45-1373(+)